MSQETGSKINQLMREWPRGVVYTASWLNERGYPYDLVNHYRESGWLESVGHGAVVRADDTEVDWTGGVYALQEQLGLPIHPGALTALELRGHAHDVRFGTGRVYLFGEPGQRLPGWFEHYDWKAAINYHTSKMFFDAELGLTKYSLHTFSITVSSPERAMLELLSLVPKASSFEQAVHAMESLLGLRPKLVEQLLSNCSSIKVKRLFLYLADELGMPWFDSLNLKRMDLGSGKRVIAGGGQYNAKYQISVPPWRTDSR